MYWVAYFCLNWPTASSLFWNEVPDALAFSASALSAADNWRGAGVGAALTATLGLETAGFDEVPQVEALDAGAATFGLPEDQLPHEDVDFVTGAATAGADAFGVDDPHEEDGVDLGVDFGVELAPEPHDEDVFGEEDTDEVVLVDEVPQELAREDDDELFPDPDDQLLPFEEAACMSDATSIIANMDKANRSFLILAFLGCQEKLYCYFVSSLAVAGFGASFTTFLSPTMTVPELFLMLVSVCLSCAATASSMETAS